MKLSNYLTFNGNCREAFDFYKKVFNAELVDINTFDQMPSDDNMPPLDENDKNRILHICIKIGEDSFLMGSDTLGCMKQNVVMGTNFSLSLATNSREETEQLFHLLSQGGVVTMPLEDTFWGAYFGMLKDRFGIQWMLSYDTQQ